MSGLPLYWGLLLLRKGAGSAMSMWANAGAASMAARATEVANLANEDISRKIAVYRQVNEVGEQKKNSR